MAGTLWGADVDELRTLARQFSINNLRREWRASKLRKLKGLPKPRFALTDDQARTWFEANPSEIAITRENFPDSTRPFPGEANY